MAKSGPGKTGKAKAASRAPGRARRDAVVLLRAALSEFYRTNNVQCHVKYLGSEWKNVNRNWSNYLTDLEEMIKTESDPMVLTEYETLKKTVTACKQFLNKWSSSGPNSMATVRMYEHQVNFCAMEPAVQNPFPIYVKKMMHSQSVQEAWPANYFWSKMADVEIRQLELTDESMHSLQIDLVVGKIHNITEQADEELDVVKQHLRELYTGFSIPWHASRITGADMKRQLDHIGKLVDRGQVVVTDRVPTSTDEPPIFRLEFKELVITDLEAAIDACDKEPILLALKTYPHGRSIIEHAKAAKTVLASCPLEAFLLLGSDLFSDHSF